MLSGAAERGKPAVAAAGVDGDACPPQHRRVDHDARWRALVREVPDFPRPGVRFRDITPLLYGLGALRAANDALA